MSREQGLNSLPAGYFPTASTTLSSEAVVRLLLPPYNLGGATTCRFFYKGINDLYRVESRNGIYFLRIYSAGHRTRLQIDSEIKLLNYLHEQKLGVSIAVKKSDGQYIQPVKAPEGTRYAVLFTSAPGERKEFLTSNQSSQLGEITALLHLYTDRMREPSNRYEISLAHLIHQPLRALRPYFKSRMDDFHYLKAIGKDLETALAELKLTTPQYGICHGDLHPANVHFSRTKPTLFDFDLFGYGWRSYDLAVFLWSRQWYETSRRKRKLSWNAFLDGYQQTRVLSYEELRAIDYFGVARQIWFMGLRANMSNTWGSISLDDQFFDEAIHFIKSWVKEYDLQVA